MVFERTAIRQVETGIGRPVGTQVIYYAMEFSVVLSYTEMGMRENLPSSSVLARVETLKEKIQSLGHENALSDSEVESFLNRIDDALNDYIAGRAGVSVPVPPDELLEKVYIDVRDKLNNRFRVFKKVLSEVR